LTAMWESKLGCVLEPTLLLIPRGLGGGPHCSPLECLTRGIDPAQASRRAREGRGFSGRLGVTYRGLEGARDGPLELRD
jgi:hypothetical protein